MTCSTRGDCAARSTGIYGTTVRASPVRKPALARSMRARADRTGRAVRRRATRRGPLGVPAGWCSGLGQWVLPAGPAFYVGQDVPAVGQVGQVAAGRGVDVTPGTGVRGVLVSGQDHGEAEYLGAGFAGPVDERSESAVAPVAAAFAAEQLGGEVVAADAGHRVGVAGEADGDQRRASLRWGLAGEQAAQPFAPDRLGGSPGLVRLDHVAPLRAGGFCVGLGHVRDLGLGCSAVVAVAQVADGVPVALRVGAHEHGRRVLPPHGARLLPLFLVEPVLTP